MWLDQECRGANQVVNMVLMAVILAEPFGHALIALKYAAKPGWGLPLLAGVSGVFVVLMAFGINPYADRLCALPITVGHPLERHLRWGWIPPNSDYFRIFFTVLLAAPFFWLTPRAHSAIYILYTLSTASVTRALLKGGASFESMWCWLAVGGSLLPFVLGWRLLGGDDSSVSGGGRGDSNGFGESAQLLQKSPSHQQLNGLDSQVQLAAVVICQ